MLSIKTMVMMYSIYKTVPYIKTIYKYCNTVIYIFNVLIANRGYETEYYEIKDEDAQYEQVSTDSSDTSSSSIGADILPHSTMEDAVTTYLYNSDNKVSMNTFHW